MAQRKHIEHPDDWNMHEGPFAKVCSQLGYRLITLSDRWREKGFMDEIELNALSQIEKNLRAIGG